MAPAGEDWAALLERLLEGDRLALAKLTRLVASFLSRWNAFDFHDEWDDLIQEVLLAAARAMQQGRLRERKAVAAYLKQTTRNKYADRLKRHLDRAEDAHLPWEDVLEADLDVPEVDAAPGARRDVHGALARLSEPRRQAVTAVYLEGRTYDEAAEVTGIPLGSLKRHLREGLAELRRSLAAFREDS
ncbi:MAG: RNA polymerase sigma factor [Myxococcota bacterium]